MNDIIVAKNNRDPSITFSGSVGANYQNSSGSDNTYNPRNLNLSVNKSIFDGYKTEYSIDQANELYKQAEYNFESLRQRIFLEAINSYLDLIKLNKIEKISSDNLSLSKTYLNYTQEEFKLGDTTELELEQAKLDYEINKFNIQKIQKQIDDEEITLNNYTNQKILNFTYPNLDKSSYGPSLSSNLEFAISNNPEILASNIYLKVLQNEIFIVRSENLPKIDMELGVSKNWDSSPTIDEVDEYKILGKVTIPLYESKSVKLKESNINLDILRNEKLLQDKKLNLKKDITITWNNLFLLEEEFNIAKKQIKINDKNLINKNESYDIGVISNIELIESKIEYNNHMIEVEELNNKMQKSHYLFLSQLGNLDIIK
jgi:outer membrane protein TolC